VHHKPFGVQARWGSLQHSPDPLAGLRGGPRGKREREGEEREGWCREEWGGEGWKKEKGGVKGWRRERMFLKTVNFGAFCRDKFKVFP